MTSIATTLMQSRPASITGMAARCRQVATATTTASTAIARAEALATARESQLLARKLTSGTSNASNHSSYRVVIRVRTRKAVAAISPAAYPNRRNASRRLAFKMATAPTSTQNGARNAI